VQPIEFLHRPGYRTGLGATPAAPEPPQRKKYIKPGESREAKVNIKYTIIGNALLGSDGSYRREWNNEER
jgi:hypothetical protein